jgi:membrane-bound lytic murein transglycosylase MltF
MPYAEWHNESSPQLRLASLSSELPTEVSAAAVLPAGSDPAQTGDAEKDQDRILPEVPFAEVCETLAASAQAHGLPVPFFARLIWQESRFDPLAVSPAGARGVAQFMPKVAAELGLENPFDPIAALPVSARFLQSHYRTFGNLGLAAAAYNAGPRRVLDWLARRGKLPDETRKYVLSITGQPPEKWIEEKPLDLTQKLPPRAPCVGIAQLSRSAQATRVDVQLDDGIVKIIESAKAEAARAAKAAKAKPAKGKTKAAKSERLASDKTDKTKAKTSAKGRVRVAENP